MVRYMKTVCWLVNVRDNSDGHADVNEGRRDMKRGEERDILQLQNEVYLESTAKKTPSDFYKVTKPK